MNSEEKQVVDRMVDSTPALRSPRKITDSPEYKEALAKSTEAAKGEAPAVKVDDSITKKPFKE